MLICGSKFKVTNVKDMSKTKTNILYIVNFLCKGKLLRYNNGYTNDWLTESMTNKFIEELHSDNRRRLGSHIPFSIGSHDNALKNWQHGSWGCSPYTSPGIALQTCHTKNRMENPLNSFVKIWE